MTKSVSVVLAALGGVALVFGGLKFHSAHKTRPALNAGALRQKETSAQIVRLETQLQASVKRAEAIEGDNAMLAGAIEKVRAENAAYAQSEAASLRPEAVEERFRQARALVSDGDPETVLRELLWCYDEGFPRAGGSRGRTALSTVASAIAQLGTRYPAAIAALSERLEKARQRVLANAYDTDAVAELSYLGRALRDEQTLAALYDRVPIGDPRRGSLANYGFAQFVAQRRYADVLVGRDGAAMISAFELDTQERPLPPDAPYPERMEKLRRDSAIRSAATNVEVLAGAGRIEQARSLAGKILKYDASPETQDLLKRHLTRAGQPDLLSPPTK
jgi:hypothetical protein